MPQASLLLNVSFVALAVLVGAAFPFGLYLARIRLGRSAAEARGAAGIAAAGTALWMALTLGAAATGLLAFGPLPPPVAILFTLIVVGAISLGLSRVGEQLAIGLPLAALVGIQGFRFPLELAMHRAFTEGLMPEQMSYSGLNFDILTGISALVVAGLLLAGRMPLWGVRLWNWMGFLLLLNILTIAWLSAPTPLRVFWNEPANVWISQAPFVWLPSVLVFAALTGHIVIFRRLRVEVQRSHNPRPERVPAAARPVRRAVSQGTTSA
jgi:hypothetical protein